MELLARGRSLRDIASLSLDIPEADCLLVVPPLAHLYWPSLAVHQLQACAREAGFEVVVLYMNVLFGALVGPREYLQLASAPTDWLLGDRLFARAAFGAPPLGYATERFLAQVEEYNSNEVGDARYPIADLFRYEEHIGALVDSVAGVIADRAIPVVGASTTFDQTAASVALLSRVKALRPEICTILGGANCEGEMADGIRSLSDAIDHVFSGESEQTFVRFLRARRGGGPPGPAILRGTPCRDLDALPTPGFREYFDQVRRTLPDIGDTSLWVSYETSRGCWWGQKHHCTFCGLNGLGMGFREKSADRVVAQLTEILADCPTRHVCMTDNTMPWRYHETLLPRIPAEIGDVHVFYEQKSNLTLTQMKRMWDAGAMTIQAGIEALDSDLLRLMRKGVLARQNISLLRYASSLGMRVEWNLLWGFPGDDAESYRRTLELLPKLRHLWPPPFVPMFLDRFSPYFDDPEGFGITELAPLDSYTEVFPPRTDLRRLAYHFWGTYPSGSKAAQTLMEELKREVSRWRDAWTGHSRPTLSVNRAGPGRYVLVDTRGLETPPTLYLNEAQARAVLVGTPKPWGKAGEWAMLNGYAVHLDGWCVPLAVAPYPLLNEFEEQGSGRGELPLTVVSLG
jgi:ribosomal peptide maturation radical SAM protein 1